MSILFTADLHLGHRNICKHTPRPWSCIEEHDQALIDNWNKKVHKDDTTYIVGDFAFKDHSKYLAQLKGKKILILGSHDKMKQDVLRNFTEVHPCKMVSINGLPIWLSHCAQRVWERSHYGSWHLFGHSHGRLRTWNLSMDVGVDVLDGESPKYEPWSIDEIFAKMNIRKGEMHDSGRIEVDEGKEMCRQDDVSYWCNKYLDEVDKPMSVHPT
jgi:calcineurin-like phosphoesterase family protein